MTKNNTRNVLINFSANFFKTISVFIFIFITFLPKGDPEQFPGLQFLVDRYHPSNEVWLYCIETSAW